MKYELKSKYFKSNIYHLSFEIQTDLWEITGGFLYRIITFSI